MSIWPSGKGNGVPTQTTQSFIRNRDPGDPSAPDTAVSPAARSGISPSKRACSKCACPSSFLVRLQTGAIFTANSRNGIRSSISRACRSEFPPRIRMSCTPLGRGLPAFRPHAPGRFWNTTYEQRASVPIPLPLPDRWIPFPAPVSLSALFHRNMPQNPGM